MGEDKASRADPEKAGREAATLFLEHHQSAGRWSLGQTPVSLSYFQDLSRIHGTMARDKGRFQGFQFSAGNVWFGLQTLAMLSRAAEPHTGFGQEIATEKSKILAKCLNSSNPSLALQMLSDCGMNVTREPLVIGSSPIDWKVALVMQLPLGISSLGSGLPQLRKSRI